MLIEDDAGRIERFAHWTEGSEFVLTVARSGGRHPRTSDYGTRRVDLTAVVADLPASCRRRLADWL